MINKISDAITARRVYGNFQVCAFNYDHNMYAVHKFEIATTKTQLACKSLLSQASDFYTGRAYKVTRLIDRATAAVNMKLEQADAKSSRLIGALDNLSPLKILKRGYFRLEKGDATVSGVAGLKVGDKLKATGSDGYAIATVESINLNKE